MLHEELGIVYVSPGLKMRLYQPLKNQTNSDAYSPAEIATRVETAGVRKAKLALVPTLVLAILAGAFIAFGALLFTIVTTDSGLGFGPERLLGGLAFSLGLILVLIGGAELFTGNSLIVFAWADRKISFPSLMRNWGLVYLGNFVGASATAAIIYWSGIYNLADGEVAATAIGIAENKVSLSPIEAFIRGVLCNVMVCLAVWLCFSARTVSGKVFAIVFPVTGFVAMGFEHSIANMFFMPTGWLLGSQVVEIGNYASNLLFVTIGNIFGGGVLVALVYWLVYGKS
jgi:formate transporter